MIKGSGRRACIIFLAVGLAYIAATPALAVQTATFHFAPLGSSFLAFLPPDSPLVGRQIISARIFLDVESNPGSDAANFFTDISFPIAPFPGNENALALSGSDLGWSGSGTFHFSEETTLFNGIFVSARYGGETPGEGFSGTLLETSRIEFTFVPDSDGTVLLFVIGTVPLICAAWLTRLRIRHGRLPGSMLGRAGC
jgi:hypothetical protein